VPSPDTQLTWRARHPMVAYVSVRLAVSVLLVWGVTET